MTTPDERKTAKQEADEALEHAREMTTRAIKIGERWRQSQLDNNFRLMLRGLGQKAT